MAIEYDFNVSAPHSALHLLETVHLQFGLPWSRNRTFLDGTGVQVSASAFDCSGGDTFDEGFGFRPDVRITFRLSKETGERRDGYRTIIEVVVGLLGQEAGPAVLLFNGETILLQRLAGELTVNPDWQTWQGEGLDLITLAYTMRSLPSPLL